MDELALFSLYFNYFKSLNEFFYKKRRMDARFIIEDLSGRSDQNPHNAVISKFDFTNTKETD